MASPTQRTWVWVDSRSWWWTGRPGILRFMGSQRVRYDWVTELNWTSIWSSAWMVSIILSSRSFILPNSSFCYSLPLVPLYFCKWILKSFLVREACVSVLVRGNGFLLSGVQWRAQWWLLQWVYVLGVTLGSLYVDTWVYVPALL